MRDQVRLILFLYLSFPLLISTQWHHLSGNQTINTPSDYTQPFPGGVNNLRMVIDSIDHYLYVFGGNGYDDSASGIVIMVCIDK